MSLPRKVGTDGALDGRAELVVVDMSELFPRVVGDRRWRRQLARATKLGGPRALDGGNLKTQLVHRKASVLKARNDVGPEHGELLRPYARRGPYKQRATIDAARPRAIGNAMTDDFSPQMGRNRRRVGRKAIFAGAIEHIAEPFRSGKPTSVAGASSHAGGIALPCSRCNIRDAIRRSSKAAVEGGGLSGRSRACGAE